MQITEPGESRDSRSRVRYLIPIAVGIIVIIALSTSSQVQASSPVDSTSTGNPLGWSNQRRIFRNPRGTQAYYVLYANSNDANPGKVNYAYSSDGSSWTTDQGVWSTASAITSTSVTYVQDGSGSRLLVYVCGDLGVGTLGSTNSLFFRIGEITDSATAINWLINDQTVEAGSLIIGHSACSIGVDNNGRIGIAFDRALPSGIPVLHEARGFLSTAAKPTTTPTWTEVTGLSDQSLISLTTVTVLAAITPATGDINRSPAATNLRLFLSTQTPTRSMQFILTGTGRLQRRAP